MTKPSQTQVETARRILRRQVEQGTAQERAAAVGQRYDTVYLRLSPLVGSASVRALFARSVGLLLDRHPFFAALAEPAALAGRGALAADPADLLRACLQDQAPVLVTDSAVALFATFFALLDTFIGARLSAQVMEAVGTTTGESTVSERKP